MKVHGNLQVRGSLIIPVAHFREQQTSGTPPSPAGLTTSAWNTRTLNTTVVNEIPNCSLGSNRVTLPAGRYWIKGVGNALAADAVAHEYRCRIQNITTSSTLIVGPNFAINSALDDQTVFLTPVEGLINLNGTTLIELQQWVDSTSNAGQEVSITGVNEVYSEIFIWKL